MKFKLASVDLRTRPGGGGTSVSDEDTGKAVRQIIYGPGPTRSIILLGKYGGEFKTDEECDAFAKGVAAVLII
jgi:hypothetical protein